MSLAFEELDYQMTEIGAISLRRRREPRLNNVTVYEVKLGDEFLMSSLFTVGEIALAEQSLRAIAAGAEVVVGGLGLGYTAQAALREPAVAEVVVVEALAPVISWHEQGLVPLGPELSSASACRFVEGDFFELVRSAHGFDPDASARCFDAILLDIDHAPDHRLDSKHDAFYTTAGLRALRAHLKPGGIFAMWSNDPPDSDFVNELAGALEEVSAEVIEFANPYTGHDARCTLYSAVNRQQ